MESDIRCACYLQTKAIIDSDRIIRRSADELGDTSALCGLQQRIKTYKHDQIEKISFAALLQGFSIKEKQPFCFGLNAMVTLYQWHYGVRTCIRINIHQHERIILNLGITLKFGSKGYESLPAQYRRITALLTARIYKKVIAKILN